VECSSALSAKLHIVLAGCKYACGLGSHWI